MTCTSGAIQSPPTLLEISMPGGISIRALSATGPGMIATDLSMVSSLMTQLGPALAALSPILKVIDAVTSLFTVLQRAPEIPVDPAGFIEALEEAAQKIAALAPLIPQVSIPATIASTIAAVSAYARAISAQVGSIATAQAQAQALLSQATAAGDGALQAEAQCALDNAAVLMEHAGAAMGPLGSVLDAVAGFMSFIPSPVALPAVPDPAGMGAQQLADALDALVAVLDAIKIPGA